MGFFCIGTFFKKLSHKRYERSIQKQTRNDAQIKLDEQTKLNTESNSGSELIAEPRPVMEATTEQEYNAGVTTNQETERDAITITVNDIEGVTQIQEVINLNHSVFLNEVSSPARVKTTEKDIISGSQGILQMVEDNHTAITKELSDRESLEMVAIDMNGQETRITWRGIITPE